MEKNRMRILVCLFIISLLFGCSGNGKKEVIKSENRYISGHTTGTIPSSAPIEVFIDENLDFDIPDNNTLNRILRVNPAVKGKLTIRNNNSLLFVPEENLKNGQEYEVTLNLGALADVPKVDRNYSFKFDVVKLKASFKPGNITINEDNSINFEAVIQTSDIIDNTQLENKVKATRKGESIPIVWEHSFQSHRISVNHIEKKKGAGELIFHFDKGLFTEESHSVLIPDEDQFSVLNSGLVENNRNQLKIVFTDILDPRQNLAGLIVVEGIDNISFKIERNTIYAYYKVTEKKDRINLTVHKGIKNEQGQILETEYTRNIPLPSSEPAVKFIGTGTIVPSEGKLLIPFSAVALKAVDVQVIKVYDQNMNFFLQNNDMNGSYGLVRTGRPVLTRKFDLTKEGDLIDLNVWNDFVIDLSGYFKPEKGVIYRIEIRFKKAYTILACASDGKEDQNLFPQDWDGNNSYYDSYYYNPGYRWEERNDPCSESYYNGNRFIGKNIINTSLGIVAKRAINNYFFIAVNDIMTAAPVVNCKVYFYNYQNQIIDSTATDNDGFAYIRLQEKPFIVQANRNEDKAWLKINDASALSLSNFNVSGENVQSGLKGFIYGERGVWRPGDDIFISFILENKMKVIPEGHPVIAELLDTKGNIIQSKKSYIGQSPINTFKFNTDPDAETGYWKVNIKIGGSLFSKTLKIETIKPNRLSINLEFANDRIIGEGIGNTRGAVKTRWLTGAPTPHRKAVTEVKLSQTSYRFSEYPDYVFNNPSFDFQPYSQTLFDGKTDEQGNYSFNLSGIKLDKAPGIMSATFTTRVFEESGDFSINTYSTYYSPYPRYAGFKLPQPDNGWYAVGKDIPLTGVIITPQGEKIRDEGSKINIKVYKINWRWWWDSASNEYGQYVNRSHTKPVFEKNITSRDASFTSNINVPSYGRYLIEVTDTRTGQSSGKIAWFGSWADNSNADMATVLNIDTDKQSYHAGETIRVSIPSSVGGTAIFSVENGMTFKEIARVPTMAGRTTYEIQARSDMCPNIYIGVTLLQPHTGRDNDRPVRMYGVASVAVDDPVLHLNPVIKSPTEVRPSSAFEVTISEKEGKEMDYTIAIVDEGLLSITSFRTPDPFAAMYTREALGVKTWDFYDQIFGAYGIRLEKAFAIGGDESINTPQDETSNRFKPVVLFKGPFHLKKGETHTVSFDMPEYIGEIRTTVVAADPSGKYGSASVNTTVRQPLMISVAMPRIFTPGDELEIPVTVFAMNDNIREVQVNLKTDQLMDIIGESRQNITFGEKGEQIVWYKARIKEETGNSTISVNGSSGKEKTSSDTQVEIRIPNPRIREIKSGTLAPGESLEFNHELLGAEPVSILEIASIPPLNLGERLDFLISYPHGCVEQITSAAFPQVSLPFLLELDDIQKERVENNVKTVIQNLSKYQTASGGFAYWPGGTYEADWATVYSTHFLLSAQKLGYDVPGMLLRKALTYLRATSNSVKIGSPYEEMSQAYRLYVLALAGQSDAAAMNRLKERSLHNNTAKWLLASAYALTNHRETALNLVRNVSVEVVPYRQTGGSYGSDLRDKAIILQAMVTLDMQEEAFAMLKEVSAELSSDKWWSTQTVAFSLLAATDYVTRYVKEIDQLDLSVTTSAGNKKVRINRTVYQEELPLKNNKSYVKITNNSKSTLYLRQINSYAPFGVASQQISSGLEMNISYRDDKGNTVHLNRIPQGTDITAEITIRNSGTRGVYENLALNYMLPSGFEIINDRLTGNMNVFKEATHVDIRDDRYYVYFDLKQNETKTFTFRFNAAFAGTFLKPAIECSAMYDNSIQAVLPGGRVTVRR